MVEKRERAEMWTTIFSKYLGGILAAATIGLFLGGTGHLFAFWSLESEFNEYVKASETEDQNSKQREEDIQSSLKILIGQIGQVMQQQEEFKGLILTPTIEGRGTVGEFGFDTAFVDINEYGKASMYLKAERVSITVKDSDGIVHTSAVNVRGSFRNQSDSGHLVIFSDRAADELGVGGISDITVGPVGK
jgi:hypothetical protein